MAVIEVIVYFVLTNTISKSKMILRRLDGGDEAYCTYVEEADNDANKNSALI
jgi:hypothetical protein